jgi:hypothetical protein
MKKLDKPLSKEYPPLKLYLEDVEEIERILSDGSSTVSVETDDYTFPSVKEFAESYRQKRIHTLHIKGSNPYVTIDFDRVSSRIYVSSSSTDGSGIFYLLDQVLRRRILPGHWLYSFKLLMTLNILIPVASTLGLTGPLPVTVTLSSLLLFWMFRAAYVRLKRHSLVVVSDKLSRQGFLRRNKDNLAIVIISALLGAVLGVGGTLLVNYLAKQ